MSTVARPFGARPIGTLSSSGHWAAKRFPYTIATGYATNIFYGDFVKLVGAGTIEKDTGTTALDSVGIFVGCSYEDTSTGQFLTNQYWPASTAATNITAYVVNDPFVLFQMQADEAIAQTALGLNFPVVQTAGATAVGTSKNAVDGGSGATTNTLPLKLVGFVDGPDSSPGDTYTDVIMMFNPPSDPAAATGHQLLVSLGF